MNPITPLRITIAMMTTVSLSSPMSAVTSAAIMSTMIMVFVNCSTNRRQVGLRSRSMSSFGPKRASRLAASAAPSPVPASVPRAAASDVGSAAQGRAGVMDESSDETVKSMPAQEGPAGAG